MERFLARLGCGVEKVLASACFVSVPSSHPCSSRSIIGVGGKISSAKKSGDASEYGPPVGGGTDDIACGFLANLGAGEK